MRNLRVDMAKRLIGIITRHFLTWKVKFLNCIEHNELRTDTCIPGYTTCVLPYPPNPHTKKTPITLWFHYQTGSISWLMLKIGDSYYGAYPMKNCYCLRILGAHFRLFTGIWRCLHISERVLMMNNRTNNLTVLTNIKIL